MVTFMASAGCAAPMPARFGQRCMRAEPSKDCYTLENSPEGLPEMIGMTAKRRAQHAVEWEKKRTDSGRRLYPRRYELSLNHLFGRSAFPGAAHAL